MFNISIALLCIAASAASIWFFVIAFKKGVGWGFAVLLIPFASLYFAFKFWRDVKKPLFISLSSSAAAMLLLASTLFNAPEAEHPAASSSIHLAKETAPAASQRTLSEEETHALDALEKTIEMIEKLPKDKKQQQFLSVMKKQVHFKRSVLSDPDLDQFKKEVEAILNRTDLNKNQRRDFEEMLQEIQREALPGIVLPPVPAPVVQTAAIQAGLPKNTPMKNVPVHIPDAALPHEAPRSPRMQPEEGAFDRLEETQVSKEPRYKRISFAQAKDHVGSAIAFKGPRGSEQECVLVRVAEKQLHCRKDFIDGTFSFSYQQHEIKALKVLPR